MKKAVPVSLTRFNPAVSPRLILPLEEKTGLIESTNWFNFLQRSQIETLTDYVDLYQLQKNCVVFEEGAADPYFGAIASGVVEIVKQNSRGIDKVITVLHKGSVFGEMSLIDGLPRSASAVVKEDLTLILLHREKFNLLSHEKGRLAFDILMRIASLISQRLRQTSRRLVDWL